MNAGIHNETNTSVALKSFFILNEAEVAQLQIQSFFFFCCSLSFFGNHCQAQACSNVVIQSKLGIELSKYLVCLRLPQHTQK